MDTFDDIQVRRPELAQSYLGLIEAEPGRPLAMFAPRRVGKTFFLDNDLAPAATRRGWWPVYADLWLSKAQPLQAINHALEEALDDALVPSSALGRTAKTEVKKIGLLGAALDFGDTPARRALPEAPELRLDALIARLGQAVDKPVFLMLDEIQSLADAPDGDAVIASLRAVLHKRRKRLKAVFTGSSQEALTRMLTTVGAPMYQFAQLLNFPVLGDEFLRQLASHFGKVHGGRRPLLDDLRRCFATIGFKPALMKDVVKAMSAEGVTDVDLGVRTLLGHSQHVAGWRAMLQGHDLFDRLLLQAIAKGLPPMGKATLSELTSASRQAATVSKVRVALERLRKSGLLDRHGGTATLEDPLLAQYLIEKSAQDLA